MVKMDFKKSFLKTVNSFKQILPILGGVVMLIGLFISVVPKNLYQKFFTGNTVIDSLAGAFFGSIATGNPITSYIIGGEFLKQGISLVAVAAFILTWVTVGIIQLPAESLIFGKKFAITRNIICFLTALVVAVLTVFTLSFL